MTFLDFILYQRPLDYNFQVANPIVLKLQFTTYTLRSDDLMRCSRGDMSSSSLFPKWFMFRTHLEQLAQHKLFKFSECPQNTQGLFFDDGVSWFSFSQLSGHISYRPSCTCRSTALMATFEPSEHILWCLLEY